MTSSTPPLTYSYSSINSEVDKYCRLFHVRAYLVCRNNAAAPVVLARAWFGLEYNPYAREAALCHLQQYYTMRRQREP